MGLLSCFPVFERPAGDRGLRTRRMNKDRRLQREDPARTRPIRNWGTLFRRSDSRGPEVDKDSKYEDSTNRGRSWDDVVSNAVERGYKVIEEQIRQGQRVAQQLTDRSYGPRAMGGDATELVERVLGFYTDLGALWFDLIDSMMRNPILSGDVMRSPPPSREMSAPGASGNGAAANGHSGIPIEIASASPTRVTLNISAPPNGCRLGVHELCALDKAKPPLTDIHFDNGAECPTLRISIPQRQPPDTYSGTVIDTDTNEPLGTLCILIRGDGADCTRDR